VGVRQAKRRNRVTKIIWGLCGHAQGGAIRSRRDLTGGAVDDTPRWVWTWKRNFSCSWQWIPSQSRRAARKPVAANDAPARIGSPRGRGDRARPGWWAERPERPACVSYTRRTPFGGPRGRLVLWLPAQ